MIWMTYKETWRLEGEGQDVCAQYKGVSDSIWKMMAEYLSELIKVMSFKFKEE